MNRFIPLVLAGTFAVSACGAAPDGAATADTEETLAYAAEYADLIEATEKYKDVQVALDDGYIPDPLDHCMTAEMEGVPAHRGGMGIHYFRPDLLQITETEPRINGEGTHTDFMQPGVLIYEPQADGSLELIAIENLVFEKAWEEAGNENPPSFRGMGYYHMVDNPRTEEADEAHLFRPHYELHLWVHRENPNGVAAQFNPNVTCEHHQPSGDHAPAGEQAEA